MTTCSECKRRVHLPKYLANTTGDVHDFLIGKGWRIEEEVWISDRGRSYVDYTYTCPSHK